MNTDLLWVEKYRPSCIDDVILPDGIKNTLKNIIEKQELINLVLYGPPGSGKTTCALAITNELDSEYLFLNGSLGADESGIEAFRTKVRSFASSVALNGERKVVIIDEADYLNHTVQPALRGLIEEFASNCSFILTCNYINRILPPIISRFSLVDFTISKDDKPTLAAYCARRLSQILKAESVEIDGDKKILGSFVLQYFPDLRKAINELQIYYIKSGKIDVGILSKSTNGVEISEFIDIVKSKDYDRAHEWAYENLDGDLQPLLKKLYHGMKKYFVPKAKPQVVALIEDSLYRSKFVDDPEISFMAFTAQLMIMDAVK